MAPLHCLVVPKVSFFSSSSLKLLTVCKLVLRQENVVIKKVELQLEGVELDKAITPVVREFFEHGDTYEVLVRMVMHRSCENKGKQTDCHTEAFRLFCQMGETIFPFQESLADMNIAEPYRIPEVAVSLALEQHNPQREMTSRLISDMYGDYLNQEEIARGFDNMLRSLGDLSLDTPDAPVVSSACCVKICAAPPILFT